MKKFNSKKSNTAKALTRALSGSLQRSPVSPRPSPAASREGWLRKRTTKSGVRKVWCERYFVLRGSTLSYYDRQIDAEAKATFELTKGCKVGDIYLGSRKEKGGGGAGHGNDEDSISIDAISGASSPDKRSKKGKSKEGKKKEKLYCIKITWPAAKSQDKDEKEADRVVEAITGGEGKSKDTPMTKSTALEMTPDRQSIASTNVSRLHARHASATPAMTDVARNISQLSPTRDPHTSPKSLYAQQTPPKWERVRSKSADEASFSDIAAVENDNYVRVQSPTPSEEDGGPAMSQPTTPTAPDQPPKSPRSASLTYKPSDPMAVSPPSMSHSEHHRAPSPSSAGNTTLRASSEQGALPLSALKPTPKMQRSSTITEGIPILPKLGDNTTAPAIPASRSSDSQRENATAGLQRHYEEQIIIQRQEEEDEKKVLSSTTSRQQQEEMYKMLYLAAKKATQKKYKKRVMTGTKIAAATGAAITAGALTAGVGLVAGLVFVGIAGGLSGTGAAAGAAIGRGPGNKKLVLAAATLEDAMAWKEALENAMNEIALEGTRAAREMDLNDSTHQIDDDSSTWKKMFEREGRRASSLIVRTSEEKAEETIEKARSFKGIGRAEVGVGAVDTGEKHALRVDSGIQPAHHEMAQTGSIFEPGTRWRPLEVNWATLLGTGAHGLRIFCEEKYPGGVLSGSSVSRLFRSRVGVEGHPSPPLKAHVVLDASPLNAFMCLMCNGRIQSQDGGSVDDNDTIPLVPNSGQVASFSVIKTLDDHMDIIHLVMRPLYLFPSWTAPRDFVLVRYWRLESDGSYVVCYDSIEHRDCPPTPGYVRGGLHSVCTISPRKRSKRHSESLLTHVVQVDPHGWVPTFSLPLLANNGYVEAFQVSALLQMIDIRDALDHDRFVPMSLDARPHKHWSSLKSLYTKAAEETTYPEVESETAENRSRTSSAELDEEEDENADNYDFSYATHERSSVDLLGAKNRFADGASIISAPSESVDALNSTISNDPPPLVTDWWSEPDANSFRVRGKMYKKDKKKFNAGDSMFRLIAIDIISVDASVFDGICHQPQERVQRALKREKKLKARGLPSDMPPFVVCINIVLPGPPYYHFATYYAVDDMSSIDGSDGTPSSKLANQFFFGDSDEFRDQTFKLIPQIVEGNFIVRKAVGTTPAIMGTKLKQTYVRTDRFFEIVLDIGSSSVAAGVIRICNSYAKHIVVDMAFLLEGNDESTLPERVFGTVRLKNIEFGKKLRFLQTADVEVDDDE